jgi:6-phosphogluconolactonase
VVPNKQSQPRPHWTGFSPDGRFALVPDLGTDSIHVYKVYLQKQTLEHIHEIKGLPGAGPRHMRFSPDGSTIHLLNELTLSITNFKYDQETGRAKMLSTDPALYQNELAKNSFNSASEILVHPNGKWVYSANRGHDSISVFEKNEKRALKRIQLEPIRGAWPRHIQISPQGQWVLAAGADSDTISVFRVDPLNGQLNFLRKGIITIPSPMCILFD